MKYSIILTYMCVAVFAMFTLTACDNGSFPAPKKTGWEEYELKGKVKQLRIQEWDANWDEVNGEKTLVEAGEKPSDETVVDFDEEGRILREVKARNISVYTYDKHGRLTNKTNTYKGYSDTSVYVDKYIYKGYKSIHKSYKNDELTSSTVVVVNANEDTISHEYYDKGKKIEHAIYKTYYPTGELQEMKDIRFYDNDSCKTEITTYKGYEYNDKGLLSQYELSSSDRMKYTDSIEYDEEGRKIIQNSNHGYYVRQKEYNEQGFVSYQLCYERGFLGGHHINYLAYYRYVYDNYGNYIKKMAVETSWSSLFYDGVIEKRTILYY